MTEETQVVEETKPKKMGRPKKEPKNGYVRPAKVVEIWNSGVKEIDQIAIQLAEFEKTIKLKKNVKVVRDHKFYVTNIKWALTEATRKGLITDYKYTRRPPRIGVAKKEKLVVQTEVAPVKQTVNEDSLIPTL